MKVSAKTSFFFNNRLYKKDDTLEVETTSFNPFLMTEIPEKRMEKKTTSEKVVQKKTKTKKG